MKKQKSKIRIRKRKFVIEPKFTVVANDPICKDFIIEKATKHNMKTFTRGHVKNRLYFQCTEKRWQRFCKLIVKKCVFDSPVYCPKWLQKKILKNLHAAAHSRINPTGARTAEKLLGVVKCNSNKAASQAQSKTEKANVYAQSNGQPLKLAPNVNPKGQKFMGNMFSKCLNSLRNFMAKKRCLQTTHR